MKQSGLTETRVYGQQTKEVFDATAGLANAGPNIVDRTATSAKHGNLTSIANDAAQRITTRPAALIRGEMASGTKNPVFSEKDRDEKAVKRTPQTTNSFRIG